MSLHLEFEPHSWYMDAAIKRENIAKPGEWVEIQRHNWRAFLLNGMSGYIIEFTAPTLANLKQQIKDYHKAQAERDAYNRAKIGEYS